MKTELILGTPANDGDDLKAVTILDLLLGPQVGGQDQAVELHHHQLGVMAERFNHLIQLGETLFQVALFTVHRELHGLNRMDE